MTVGLNLWSIGERLTVVLGSVDGCSLVDITSTCVSKTQIADWGKNEKNVRRLFAEIDKELGDSAAHEQCMLCRHCGYLLVGIAAGVCPECGHKFSPNDKPGTQETATFKNAIVYALAFTAIEVTLIITLDVIGMGAVLPSMLRSKRGAVFLLCANLGVILGTVGMHRLVKRYTRRE